MIIPDIERAWGRTCKLLFGEEIGGLEGYRDYLTPKNFPLTEHKSAESGKRVVMGSGRYAKGSRVISQDEIGYIDKAKFQPFSINEIKDIDSIAEALGERFSYCGNKVFGESKFTNGVDNCTDSFFVQDSHDIMGSKYVAYSSFIRMGSEHVFGSEVSIRGTHMIKILGSADLARSFSCSISTACSDMMFSSYCHGCSNCLFSFNQKNRRNTIGNLELSRERYLGIKKKVVAEMVELLKKDKRLPSVFDFPPFAGKLHAAAAAPAEKFDRTPAEKGFEAATNLVFGTPLYGLNAHSAFLLHNVDKMSEVTTAYGTKEYRADYFWSKNIPETRRLGKRETDEAGKLSIALPEGKTPGFAELRKMAEAVAFYPVSFHLGTAMNCGACPSVYESADCYKVSDATYSKKSAYGTHLQNCEAVFGSGILMMDSAFSLRCHDCVKVSASLELDSCKGCHRCMFCHNCENVHDSMFCFNAKNLKYAIGNVEVGKEEYDRVRGMVARELLARLAKKGDIGIETCRLGADGKGLAENSANKAKVHSQAYI